MVVEDHIIDTFEEMRSLQEYIYTKINEADEKEEEKLATERGKIKFVIWEKPDKKVSWLNDNHSYQKIEAKYEEKPDFNDGLKISFLLGYKDDSWRLWIGKIGVVSYSDDPYCDLECKTFRDAILRALDKAEEIIKQIQDEPNNWIQFYIDR